MQPTPEVIRQTLGEIDFDPAALKARYLAERDRRLRAEAIDQYVEVKGDFSNYVDDPYCERIEREPVFDRVEVLVIGGGFGGLLMGGRLREAGFESIRMIEQGGDFGGTWYWNRYPGAMCDIESYCYLPLLEELNYVPKHKYSYAPEIMAHAQNIARHYRLYDQALLQTSVKSMQWDDSDEHWVIETDRGDRFKARFVAMANGPLNRPKLPGIPGIDTFEGHTFHTSRWDYAYTGGDSTGNLHQLANKRVGASGRVRPTALCVSAHAVFGRRAKQPRDRSRMGGKPATRLAIRAHGQLQHAGQRRRSGSGSGGRRLDGYLPQSHRHRGQNGLPQNRPASHR